MSALPDFTTPDLAAAIEALSPQQIDALPFGVIRLDEAGIVQFYSKQEAALSGYQGRPTLGLTFFTDIAPCMNNPAFRGRIEHALHAGTLDVAFSFVGDFSDRNRELDVRAQSASDGGFWMFVRRPNPAIDPGIGPATGPA